MPRNVYVVSFSHIDASHPINDPAELADLVDEGLLPCTKADAGRAFIDAGEWEGDGEIEAFWIPPFMFDADNTVGLYLWHVKQSNNGTSWLCAARPYDFPGLRGSMSKWVSIEVDGLG